MTMTTLYLVRHGETVDNARQIMQGQTQGELNATGISQAEALRDKLSDVKDFEIVTIRGLGYKAVYLR